VSPWLEFALAWVINALGLATMAILVLGLLFLWGRDD